MCEEETQEEEGRDEDEELVRVEMERNEALMVLIEG